VLASVKTSEKVGPDDVVESDVDPHELAMCHRGSWATAVLWTYRVEGVGISEVGVRRTKWV
jgi:hypothetical protein